ncbi:MAG TPA: ABC transporter permease [Gaiellaceae bacterium]|nr:ABC transporter permease [Casimicrobiaceae bacterium]
MSAAAATVAATRRRLRSALRSDDAVWRQPVAMIGLVVVVGWIVVAIFAPLVAPYDPDKPVSTSMYVSPNVHHLFGTDDLGRDILSRVIYGARISIPLALVIVALALMLGGTLGALAGYFGGKVDAAVMRVVDLVFAFPTIILAMAVAAAFGPSLRNAVLALVLVSWPLYARVVRGAVLTVRHEDYVNASRLLGASARGALVRDVLPNISGPVFVLATLELGNAVLLLSALSFLGLGPRPPTAEWGSMVASGALNFTRWWIGTFPGLAIMTAVLGFNFLGDSLRDRLDPRLSKQIRE